MNIQKYRDFELHEVTEGVHAFALTPEACRQARAHRQKSANVAPDHPWCGLWWGITNAGAQKVVDGIWDDSCTTDESARADSEPPHLPDQPHGRPDRGAGARVL